jgi:hypothetical protein
MGLGTVRVLVLVAVLAAATTGCSGSDKTLSTAQTLTSLRAAGFTRVTVHQHHHGVALIAPRGARLPPWAPVTVVRFPSISLAKVSYANGYSRAAFQRQAAEARKRPKLYKRLVPKGFPSGWRSERVCNDILVAGNPSHDATVDRRISRALALLREKCA